MPTVLGLPEYSRHFTELGFGWAKESIYDFTGSYGEDMVKRMEVFVL